MSEQLTLVEFRTWLKAHGILLRGLEAVRFTIDSVKDVSGVCVCALYEGGRFRFVKIHGFPGESDSKISLSVLEDWLNYNGIIMANTLEVGFGIEIGETKRVWLVASVYRLNPDGKMFLMQGVGKEPSKGSVARQRLIVPLLARPSSV